MERRSNYDITRDRLERDFLQYDQEAMLRRVPLRHDADYLYLTFLRREYRIDRKTGRVEWSDDGFQTANHAGHDEVGTIFDYLCCAEGSGGTHAGVALGARLFMPQTQTIGMMVDTDPFDEITPRIMREAAELLELDFTPTSDSVHLVDMCGPGYAIPSKEGNAAIRMMAENEGLFLDPVYTGKAFAGVIKLAREGKFRPTDNVLFLYSGGAGGLFAIDVDLD